MQSNKVRVVIRTRPTRRCSKDYLEIDEDKKTIEVRLPNKLDVFQFRFDKVLHECSQQEVFQECMPGLIKETLQGLNATVLAYGQTGAGKTYTMCGSLQSYELRGLIPRSLALLFSSINKQPQTDFKVSVSYCEIYSELLFDLLADGGLENQTGTELQIQEDAKGGLSVRGLTLRRCFCLEDALNCFLQGAPFRSVSPHLLNAQSNRSHCFFSVYVESNSKVLEDEVTRRSKLHLVDLAGCERPKKTLSEGTMLKESSFINKSLSFLEMVVVALGEKGREHIPYRSTRLTHLLKDTIGGNSKTCFIGNIWPEPEYLEETVSTLRFSLRMMRVANKAVVNVQVDPLALARKYAKEIQRLKQELQMHDAIIGRTPASYEASTPEELEEMRKAATQFLNGQQDDIPFTSVRQMGELLQVIRSVFQETTANIRKEAAEAASAALSAPDSEVSSGPPGSSQGPPDSKGKGGAPLTSKNSKEKPNPQGAPQGAAQGAPKSIQKVGYEDPSVGGVSLGIDSNQSEISFADKQPDPKPHAAPERARRNSSGAPKGAPLCTDKKGAFKQFCEGEGRELQQAFVNLKKTQQQHKSQLKTLCAEILECRQNLSALRESLEEKKQRETNRNEGKGDTEIPRLVDEEEFLLLKNIKELKARARVSYSSYSSLRRESEETEAALNALRLKIVAAFDAWYDKNYAAGNLMTAEEPQAIKSTGPSPAAAAAAAAAAADEDGSVESGSSFTARETYYKAIRYARRSTSSLKGDRKLGSRR